jgi:imidazolonepropionase-like amidohydrolase
VQDDRITAIEPRAGRALPNCFDLSSCTVIPGLIDCHDHLGVDIGDEVAQSKEPLGYTAIKGVKNARDMLRAGITTLRSVGEQYHLDVSWRRAVQEGLMDGPDLLICGEFIARTGGHGWFFGNEVDGVESIRKSVRRQIKAQVDWIKIMITGGMSTPGSVALMAEYSDEEIAVCIEEAHRANRKVAAHVHGGPGASAAIRHGVDSIEHGTYLTDEQLKMMVEKGTWLVSTAGFCHGLVTMPGMPDFYVQKGKKALEAAIDLLRRAREHGVRVAFGGDTYHAHPVVDMEKLVEAGYSPMQAIQIATRDAAELCGLSSVVGTIELGKRANIIAVRDNPLERIAAVGEVCFVMKGGRRYF